MPPPQKTTEPAQSDIVLLAGNNPDDAASVASAFKKLGLAHQLQVVPDGEAAVQYLKGIGPYQEREWFPFPRLILLDVHLPRMTGFRFLKWVRRQPELRCLPVVVLTASVFSPEVTRAYRLGANSFLTKPLDLPENIGAVREMADFWLNRHGNPPRTAG